MARATIHPGTRGTHAPSCPISGLATLHRGTLPWTSTTARVDDEPSSAVATATRVPPKATGSDGIVPATSGMSAPSGRRVQSDPVEGLPGNGLRRLPLRRSCRGPGGGRPRAWLGRAARPSTPQGRALGSTPARPRSATRPARPTRPPTAPSPPQDSHRCRSITAPKPACSRIRLRRGEPPGDAVHRTSRRRSGLPSPE